MKSSRGQHVPRESKLTEALVKAKDKPTGSKFRDHRSRPPSEPKKVPPYKSTRPITLVKIP